MNIQNIDNLPADQLYAIIEITTNNRDVTTAARLSQTCQALYSAIAYWRKHTIPVSLFCNQCINDRFIDIWEMNEAQRKWDPRERKEQRGDEQLRQYGDYQNMKAIVNMDLTHIANTNTIGYNLELAKSLCSNFGYSKKFVELLKSMIQDPRIGNIKSEYVLTIIKDELKAISLKSIPENPEAQAALEELNAFVASIKPEDLEENTEIDWISIAMLFLAILCILKYVQII